MSRSFYFANILILANAGRIDVDCVLYWGLSIGIRYLVNRCEPELRVLNQKYAN